MHHGDVPSSAEICVEAILRAACWTRRRRKVGDRDPRTIGPPRKLGDRVCLAADVGGIAPRSGRRGGSDLTQIATTLGRAAFPRRRGSVHAGTHWETQSSCC